MKKNLSDNVIAFLLVSLMFISSLTILSPNISYGQPDNMTFTSGEKIDFTSDTEMTFKGYTEMVFESGVEMAFQSGIEMLVFESGFPDGWLEPCDTVTVVEPLGFLPEECSWWEAVDMYTGELLGEFHVDGNDGFDTFHVDATWPDQGFPIPYEVFKAVKKIDIIDICDYFVVHWPEHWWPEPCTWWEIIDPETGEDTGYEFHVDWTNESCEFHIDEIIPGPYILPFPWYEIRARRKIPDIKTCDYFVVHWPEHWWPEPCTWWEIIDPWSGEPTGYEFHVDWTNESCEFHIDEVIPEPYVFKFPVPYVIAEQKITEIKPCDWFIIVDPIEYLPDPCSWWEVLDDTGAPTGLEFHVDVTDGFTMFHVDETKPDIIITIPPSYTVTVRKKIDLIQPCTWFKVDDPALTPEQCSWWEILDDTGAPTGIEFHIDETMPADGLFHIDEVFPEWPITIPPTHMLTAEKKIDTIVPCDWFVVIDPPTGWVPEPCSWWEIIWPDVWAGITFHVDQSGDGIFHIDFVDDPPDPPLPPPWNVTAIPYEEPTPQWYIKSPFPDYAPSGMPDFDQKQDEWGPGFYSWCGPTAVTDSLWWLDSEYETLKNPDPPVPPPTISDHYNLVTAYGQWDDHNALNVDPLVRNLAFLMDTDGQRTGLTHIGTNFIDMEVGISQYLQQQGINPVGDCDGDGDVDDDDILIIEMALGSSPGTPGWNMAADVIIDNIIDLNDFTAAVANYGLVGEFYEHTEEFPYFYWIQDEILLCQDVVLFLEFWQLWEEIEWIPLYDPPELEAGHYVTCAGVNCTTFELLISDPWQDAFEAGLTPGRSPVAHPYPHGSAVHNDAQYVSHDAYSVTQWMEPPPSPYGPGIPVYELIGYLETMGFDPSWHAFIRAAVVTSPLGVHDVAVTNVTPYKTIVGQGFCDKINATVENQGDFDENFDVTAKYDGNTIQTILGVSLAAHTSTNVTFTWDTTGVVKGSYTITVTVPPVSGETETSDNTLIDGIVKVTIPGDVNGDGTVDGMDLGELGMSWLADVGDPNYVANRDINCDGTIDGMDLGIMGMHWLETDR